MAEDPYRPRKTDHLVEPMFGGLGVTPDGGKRDPDDVEKADSALRIGWRVRVLRAMRRILGLPADRPG